MISKDEFMDSLENSCSEVYFNKFLKSGKKVYYSAIKVKNQKIDYIIAKYIFRQISQKTTECEQYFTDDCSPAVKALFDLYKISKFRDLNEYLNNNMKMCDDDGIIKWFYVGEVSFFYGGG